MRELELREKKVNDIKATGDRLINDGHPGKKTVEVRHELHFLHHISIIDCNNVKCVKKTSCF